LYKSHQIHNERACRQRTKKINTSKFIKQQQRLYVHEQVTSWVQMVS